MDHVVELVADLAEEQFGHVTVAQAAAAGAAAHDLERLVARRLAEPVVDGVIRLRAGGRHPVPRLYAAWLLLEPAMPGSERTPRTGVVSHWSALHAHQVGTAGGDAIFTTALDWAPAILPARVRLVPEQLAPTDWSWVAGMPVTTPARTLLDLIAPPQPHLDRVGRAAAAILRRGLATRDDLAAALALSGRPGDEQLQALLDLQEQDL